MKSDPGFSTVNESPSAASGAVSAAKACAACDGDGGGAAPAPLGGGCAAAGSAGAVNAAAAAPRKNLRRSTRESVLAIRISEHALVGEPLGFYAVWRALRSPNRAVRSRLRAPFKT
jgi:hypothetical protein